MDSLTEFSIRYAEDTPFAATLTCIPFDEQHECYSSEWFGRIKFDDNRYNWPNQIQTYEGAEITMWDDWEYSRNVSSGTFLMNLLENWHGEIVALFERVKAITP